MSSKTNVTFKAETLKQMPVLAKIYGFKPVRHYSDVANFAINHLYKLTMARKGTGNMPPALPAMEPAEAEKIIMSIERGK